MNRIYKQVWNRQLRCLVVASELAGGGRAVSGHAGGAGIAGARLPLTALGVACALVLSAQVAPAYAACQDNSSGNPGVVASAGS